MTNRPDETWHRLFNWTSGQAPSERLAEQILLSEGYTNLISVTMPSLHCPPFSRPQNNVGGLLKWSTRIPKTLYGRENELVTLNHWCTRRNLGRDISVMVMHGVGGAGKTRMAFEFAGALAGQGWQTGQLSDPANPIAFVLPAQAAGVLLIIDYRLSGTSSSGIARFTQGLGRVGLSGLFARAFPRPPNKSASLAPGIYRRNIMNKQALKQGLITLKQLTQRIQKQAFAKTPGPGQKITSGLSRKLPGKFGFVHVIKISLAHVGERFNTNG
jgi:hypothetical protein